MSAQRNINTSENHELKYLSPDQIIPNPENPRLIFRQEEMDSLLISINAHGIQVPITVYKEKNKYVLIDGERRWRCADKLNLKKIPALVQKKPDALQNLLMMYNIHALREQWDYFTIASKLIHVKELFAKKYGHEPNEIELSEATGLSRGQIRRCELLLNLPARFKDMLMEELKLPKSQQRLSEDFFIEMERSLKTVTNRLPEFEERKEEIRTVLVDKFKGGIIEAVTDFRQLAKIATAVENIGLAKGRAEKNLNNIFDPENEVGIREIYTKTVEFSYDEKKALSHTEHLLGYLKEVIADEKHETFDDFFMQQLKELHRFIGKLLRG